VTESPSIRPLAALTRADLERLIAGYTSPAKYAVTKIETETHVSVQLDLVTLPSPYVKGYDSIDDGTLRRYSELARNEFSLGAFDGDGLVGIALAERHVWNNSLWVWEFHIAATHRRRGLGRALMEALIEKARAAAVRVIVCETQNTNVPAIRFYRSLGFSVEGVDLSLYSNDDTRPEGEVAVFMKYRPS
jgi:ribosomal protein S18 acetylase RimI-like enzyme